MLLVEMPAPLAAALGDTGVPSGAAGVNEISAGGYVYLDGKVPASAFAVGDPVELHGTGTNLDDVPTTVESVELKPDGITIRVIQTTNSFSIDKGDLSEAYLQNMKPGAGGEEGELRDGNLGWLFCAGAFGLALVYLIVGFSASKQRTGRAAWPHSEQWLQLYGLVTDGWRWALSGGGGGGPSHGAPHPDVRYERPPDYARPASHTRKHGASAKKKQARGGKKGSKRSGKSESDAPPSPPSPVAAKEWQPTRTVHLATGARETGVKVVM